MLEVERDIKILSEYKSGKTLQDISDIFKVTRSRVQQIVSRELGKEILIKLHINYKLSTEDRTMLKLAVKEEIEQITKDRTLKALHQEKENLAQRIKNNPKLQDLSEFRSLTSYADILGTDVPTLKKLLPNTVIQIQKYKNQKWSKSYDKCKKCGTTEAPHKIKGYCNSCYTKSPYYKEMQKKSFLKNIDKRKRTMRKYLESYKERPEVKERYRKLNDLQNFDGNREKAIIRDKLRCTFCGVTRNESYQKFKRDLYVIHKKGKINVLDNLTTICRNCHTERILQIAWKASTETLQQKYTRLNNKPRR